MSKHIDDWLILVRFQRGISITQAEFSSSLPPQIIYQTLL